MQRESESNLPPLLPLSELMDGECDAQGAHRACTGWCDDAQARRQWHAWHVIGDVLRSEDLVRRPQRDALFLAALRERLADEPIVMAPAPTAAAAAPQALPAAAAAAFAPRRFRRSASSTAAIAAGFVVVVGTVAVLRPLPREPQRVAHAAAPAVALAPAQAVAQATPAAAVAGPIVAPARSTEPQALVANGQLIRDARLDQYLAAHKQYSPLGMPTVYRQSRPAATSGSR